jgi:hypothetical protein
MSTATKSLLNNNDNKEERKMSKAQMNNYKTAYTWRRIKILYAIHVITTILFICVFVYLQVRVSKAKAKAQRCCVKGAFVVITF